MDSAPSSLARSARLGGPVLVKLLVAFHGKAQSSQAFEASTTCAAGPNHYHHTDCEDLMRLY